MVAMPSLRGLLLPFLCWLCGCGVDEAMVTTTTSAGAAREAGATQAGGLGGAAGAAGTAGAAGMGAAGVAGNPAERWTFFAFGDTRTNVDIFQQTITSMITLDPSATLAINSGDLTATGSLEEWDAHHQALALGAPDPTVPADPKGIVRQSRFRTDVGDFGPFIRYLGVIGNHDLLTAGWLERWNAYLRGQAALGVNGETGIYYWLLHRGVLLVIIDSEHPSADQTVWLERVLQSPQAATATFKLAFWHQQVYPCNEKPPFAGGLEWVDLVEQYDVDLVFLGHGHTYERTCPMVNGVCSPGGVTYLEAGTAAAPPRIVEATLISTVTNGVRTDEYDCSQILESYRGEWHHFCHVAVEDCRLTIRCYGHDCSLTGEGPWDTMVVDRCP
jgi:hypothetical protein